MLESRLLLAVSPAVVSGTVWLDNGDGGRDPSEPGVARVTVKLRDAANHVVATRVTDSSGAYQFSGVHVGDYCLEFLKPAGKVFTFQQFDSAVARDTGRTQVFTLGSDPDTISFDAGLVKTASLLPAGLRITEIMYYPPEGFGHIEGDFEFIELTNRGRSRLNLKGVALVDGVAFDFTGSPITSLAPSGHVLVVKNRAAFESRYGRGLPIAGEYAGRLNDRGENLKITGAHESNMDRVSYGSVAEAAGTGFSLVRNEVDPLVPWMVGTVPGGTPGLEERAAKTAAVGGQVTSSANQDGIPNVPVRLLTTAGRLVASTKTTIAGRYDFFRLAAGKYYLEVNRLDGTWWRAPTVTLAARQYAGDVNASLTPPMPLATVSSDVWLDADGDGDKDGTDGPVYTESVVLLTDASGQVVSAAAAASGMAFGNLVPGTYRMAMTVRGDFALTLRNRGHQGDESRDSDFDPVTGLSDVFTVAPGETLAGPGAGLVGTAVTANLQKYLRIAEIMYDPPSRRGTEFNVDNNEFEFIELKNTGPVPLVMTGVRFISGVMFDFTGSRMQQLSPGGRVLVVRNKAAFESRYGAGLPVAGQYTGRLSNDGEVIELVAPINKTIEWLPYSPTAMPVAGTDGSGSSMTRNPDFAADVPDGWFPSSVSGGTPGADDPLLAMLLPGVVINEVCANAATPGDNWIELRNLDKAPADIGGWELTGQSGCYRIPANTVLGDHGYYVIAEWNFNPGGGKLPSDLVLDGVKGGELTLTALVGTLPRKLDHVKFGSLDYDATFGRHIKSTGEPVFVEMASPTPGEPNSTPRVGPLVINEVMYHPKADSIEWVELYNTTDQDVLLCDPAYPNRGWGVSSTLMYWFRPGDKVSAHGYLLALSGGEEGSFRQTYQVPDSVPICMLQRVDWGLDNSGDKVRLVYPIGGDWGKGKAPYVMVDHLVYDDHAPWPTAADGHGPSLERTDADVYANDPAYWAAGPDGGTPGRPNSAAGLLRVVGLKVNGEKRYGPSAIVPTADGIRTITVTFSQPVIFGVGSVTLQTVQCVGNSEMPTGSVWPASVTGSGTTQMTITLNAGSVVDTWLKVMLKGSGGIPVDAAGRQLDGEPNAGGSGAGYIRSAADLPSGDGTAGGDAVFYVGSLAGDFNGDGQVGQSDLTDYLTAWDKRKMKADFRGEGLGASAPDGQVTPADLDAFLALYNSAAASGHLLGALPSPGP
jgi:hypothetical protein